ncbi:MAG: heavy-metal-associated domain-containing protein [Trueperaceae bacterium]|nr:heavy-metal-associated domain-containing protein [Trueperaceae bacterium]
MQDVKTRTVLRAEGFSCPSCVAKIEKQLSRVEGVETVTVHFASSRVEVVHDESKVNPEGLVDALAKAGYRSKPAAF